MESCQECKQSKCWWRLVWTLIYSVRFVRCWTKSIRSQLNSNTYCNSHQGTLSDLDKDGSLDIDEFAVAMYLTVEVRKQNLEDLPDKLPKDWIPPSKRILFM